MGNSAVYIKYFLEIFCRFVVASLARASRKSTEKRLLNICKKESRMELLYSTFLYAIFFLGR